MYLLKMSGPQIWLCLFTFRPIASKQLNGLTTIDILSWLGGAVVTHPLWVQEVPGSIPGCRKGIYVWFFVLLLLCFTFLSKNTVFIAKYCNSFYNVNLFSILNVLQDLWPIIRVKRYRPSIFKVFRNLQVIANTCTCKFRQDHNKIWMFVLHGVTGRPFWEVYPCIQIYLNIPPVFIFTVIIYVVQRNTWFTKSHGKITMISSSKHVLK